MDELFIQPIQLKTMESGIESISANGGQVSGKGGAETFKKRFPGSDRQRDKYRK